MVPKVIQIISLSPWLVKEDIQIFCPSIPDHSVPPRMACFWSSACFVL